MMGKRKRTDDEEEESGEDPSSDSESESSESESSETGSSDEATNQRDSTITSMAQRLSKAIQHKNVLDLLHSMATSRNILFWNSHGEMLHHQRRIPVTSMIELLEYALLPYNPEVKKPRGLNTFTEGLAELGINKRLIQNKKLLADMVVKQQEIGDSKIPPDDDGSDSSDSESVNTENSETVEENSVQEERDEETSESEEENEIGDEQEAPCQICGRFNLSKTAIIRCPKCYWYECYWY